MDSKSTSKMQVGMIGLGRMGGSMVRRLVQKGHSCVVYDNDPASLKRLSIGNVVSCTTLNDFVSKLTVPRVVWMMIPAELVQATIDTLSTLLSPEDILIDGGNSHYQDDVLRAKKLQTHKLHYVDVGTSGGIAGLQKGYCLMIGGEKSVVDFLQPVFASLAPLSDEYSSTRTAKNGYLHCGNHGAGHFVKMVHNGIEYGIMGSYAEGFNILRSANVGKKQIHADAETAPIRDAEFYQYEFNLADIAEVWRHGSIISSWLLDLTTNALTKDPDLGQYSGFVSDSGEGRWALKAAIDEAIPVPIISAALYNRFNSRGNAQFSQQMLSAMRLKLGGHEEAQPVFPVLHKIK